MFVSVNVCRVLHDISDSKLYFCFSFLRFSSNHNQSDTPSSIQNRHTSLFTRAKIRFHFSYFLTTHAQEDFTLQGFELWHGFHSSMMLPDKILLFLIQAQERKRLQGFEHFFRFGFVHPIFTEFCRRNGKGHIMLIM